MRDNVFSPRIGFIGAGKVGVSLGKLFLANGQKVVGYYSRSPESSMYAASFTETLHYESMEQLINDCDMIFLTVPDSAIGEVWSSVSNMSISGKIICHCSGAMASSIFSGCNDTSVSFFSIHPMYAISSKETGFEGLEHAVFSIEGGTLKQSVEGGTSQQSIEGGTLKQSVEGGTSQQSIEGGALKQSVDGGAAQQSDQGVTEKSSDKKESDMLTTIKTWLEGFIKNVVVISPEQKVLYHAAAVFASNLVTGLYYDACKLLIECGFTNEQAELAAGKLFLGNSANVAEKGVVDALTGPVERNDLKTIEGHIANLKGDYLDIYKKLSIALVEIGSRKHPEYDYAEVMKILKE